MSLREVSGDVILTARRLITQTGGEVLLPHVCNNVGVMGAGVAAAIASAFPGVDREYRRVCKEQAGAVLGKTITEHVEPHLYVMNMIAQDGFGYDEHPPLRYEYLVHGMAEVRNLALSHIDVGVETIIVAPRFGSGLAGGNWDFIRDLIVEMWVGHGLTVVITHL
jgi:O-acetyl-ADP-ribose deacetylase (regulator of RNase III)